MIFQKNLFSLANIKKEVLSSLERNTWTDQIYRLHPHLREIIVKSDIKDRFICVPCQKHRASSQGATA